jgi:hypothetical protein
LFQHSLNNNFVVKDTDGIDQLFVTLPVEIRASDRERLGVIVDADVPLSGRWESIRAILTKNGYEVPKAPDPAGTIVAAAGRPVIGVWLMPDNRTDGMIEDFVALLVPVGDLMFPRAKTVVGAIPPEDRRFAAVHLSKAVIHTWLAWQREPGVRMGAAITRMYLQSDCPMADLFVSWLDRLLTTEKLGADGA